MSFHRIINRLLVGLLTIGLLASSASAFNLALCVGADVEHFILAFKQTTDCPQDQSLSAVEDFATSGLKAGRDGCGSCDAIYSSSHWRSKRSRVLNAKLLLPAPDAAQAVTAPSLVDSRVLPGQFPPPSPLRVPDAIQLHRTVVLLI